MKKTLTLIAALAACTAVNAQSLRFIELQGQPGMPVPDLMVEGISANGKYVCGTVQQTMGYFIADIQNEPFDIKWAISEDEEGAELRHVSNTGVAIGFNGPGATFDMEGVETLLDVPSASYKSVLGEAISDDGSLLVGSLIGSGYMTFPAYSKDYGTWNLLPVPTLSDMGYWYKQGCSAKFVSGDGKYILGGIGPIGPAILWILDENGEYQIDPLYSKYSMMNGSDTEKLFVSMRPAGISNDGRLVLLNVSYTDEHSGVLPAIYNTETKSIFVYDEVQSVLDDAVEMGIDPGLLGLTATAISDNGTFIGVVGTPGFNLGGFIMRAGETQAELLAEAFPQYAEDFYIFDMANYHMPVGISADGRYIVGNGWYSAEYKNPDVNPEDVTPYFASYVLDCGEGADVKGLESEDQVSAPDAYYTLEGLKVSDPKDGIFIRVKDGKASKVVVR